MLRELLTIVLIGLLALSYYVEWQQSEQLSHLQTLANQFKQIDIHYPVHSQIQMIIINGTNWYFGMDGNTLIYESTNATAVIEQMMYYSETKP